MAKQVNVLPNERIDIPDFEAATQGFNAAENQERFRAIFQDKFPHGLEGFRVEIADQGLFPGQITIHNGLGFDRDGQLVTSDSEVDTQRSTVLTGTATYYVEIEFTSENSDVDARAFWDPTYDNGTDPSGDARPDGREFNENVSTRITPEWRIVTPVSTTDFEINTNPNSLRIPIAVVDVAVGVVVGASTVPLRTTLREDIAAAATIIRVLNSRSMPSTFTATIDTGAASEETVTVAANDAVNGILTLAGPTVAAHNAGARVSVAGGTPAQYLPQRLTPPLPTAGSEDARPRMFHGNEEVGNALIQDPDQTVGQADSQVENLKNYVDFLAAQIRQMKVGAARVDEVGQTAPPSSFSSDFRYYENAGGILGARTNTISVGDGVNSWGDFNALQAGDAPTAIQAAIDSIPVGGTLYIKAGTYDMTSAVTVDKPIHIIGDGIGITVLDTSAATAAVIINTATAMSVRNMSITASGAAAYAVEATLAGAQSVIEDCVISGWNATSMIEPLFRNVSFLTPASGDDAFLGTLTDFRFERCVFDCSVAVAAARAVHLAAGTTKGVFDQCEMFTSSVTPTAAVRLDESPATRVKFVRCDISTDAGGTAVGFEFVNNDTRDIEVTECDIDCAGGMGQFPGSDPSVELSGTIISGCRVAVPQNGFGVRISGSGVTVKDCAFTQASTSGGTQGEGVRIDDTIWGVQATTIRQNRFFGCDVSILLSLALDTRNIRVTHNELDNTTGRGRYGIHKTGVGSISDSQFDNNTIDNILSDDQATVAGIHIEGSFQKSSCSWNIIDGIGGYSKVTQTDAYGILFPGGGHADPQVCHNVIRDVRADHAAIAIYMNGSSVRARIDNNQIRNIGNAAGDDLANQYARGIWVDDWGEISICGNNMDVIGEATATGVPDVAGIYCDPALGANAVICNNIIRTIEHGASIIAGIYFSESASIVVCNNNRISNFGGAGIAYGILVRNTDGVSSQHTFTINGNVVRDTDKGIYFDWNGAGASPSSSPQWSDITINGNTITECVDHGILIDAFDSERFNITGNQIFSDNAGVIGIEVRDIAIGAITGNSMRLNDNSAAPAIGIYVVDGFFISVTGNQIINSSTFAAGGRCIALVGISGFCSINGNNCSSSAAVVGACIDTAAATGTRIVVVGNFANAAVFPSINVSGLAADQQTKNLINNTGLNVTDAGDTQALNWDGN